MESPSARAPVARWPQASGGTPAPQSPPPAGATPATADAGAAETSADDRQALSAQLEQLITEGFARWQAEAASDANREHSAYATGWIDAARHILARTRSLEDLTRRIVATGREVRTRKPCNGRPAG